MQLAFWRVIKLWAVVRAYLYARLHLRGLSPVLYDIGARNGLQHKWHLLARAGVVDATLFEPDPAEATRLRRRGVPARLLEYALGDAPRSATLHIYRDVGLSSVRAANPDIVKRYEYGDQFDQIGEVPVTLRRLQDIVDSGEAPPPVFLKIDVQGFELEVLSGLGPRLESVLGIELEAQFEEMYLGQATFAVLYDWMVQRGFGLVAIRPSWMHHDNIFEMDAFFARRPAGLSATQLRLRRFWCIINRIAAPHELAIRGY